jgi:hypothetical protein
VRVVVAADSHLIGERIRLLLDGGAALRLGSAGAEVAFRR